MENNAISKKDLKQLGKLRGRINSDPNDQFALYELVELLWKVGEIDEAIDRCRALVKLSELSPVILEAATRFLSDNKLHKEAVLGYRKLAELQPDRALAHYSLGRILQRLGAVEESISEHRKAIRLEPDNAECHYRFGVTLAHVGRAEEAERCYKKAIALDPAHAKAYSNLGYLLDLKGQGENAIQLFRKAVQFNPQSAEVIAKAIGGRVVFVDSLASGYIANMRMVLSELIQAME